MIAAAIGFEEAVDYMVRLGARVDTANRRGETALIIAVQQRQPRVVELLLKAGANPDKADHSAGYSARDYAKRDSRNPGLLKLIQTVKPTKSAVAGPQLIRRRRPAMDRSGRPPRAARRAKRSTPPWRRAGPNGGRAPASPPRHNYRRPSTRQIGQEAGVVEPLRHRLRHRPENDPIFEIVVHSSAEQVVLATLISTIAVAFGPIAISHRADRWASAPRTSRTVGRQVRFAPRATSGSDRRTVDDAIGSGGSHAQSLNKTVRSLREWGVPLARQSGMGQCPFFSRRR